MLMKYDFELVIKMVLGQMNLNLTKKNKRENNVKAIHL